MTPPQAIDWDLVEDTIYDWITEDLGFENVIWGNSGVTQPAYPYISMVRTAGPVIEGNGFDDKRQEYNATDDTLTIEYVGPRVFTISISAHMGEGDAYQIANARGTSLLGTIQSSILMEKTKSRMNLANIAIVSSENIIDSSVVVNGIWVFRGTLDLIMRATSSLLEEVGIVEKVQVVSTGLDVDETISL